MESEQAKINKVKPVYKSWPVSQFIRLSYIAQNMYIKHFSYILSFFLTQTILQTAIPMISLIPVTNSYFSFVQPACRLICSQGLKFMGESILLILSTQVVILCGSGTLLFLLFSNSENILKICLNILSFYIQICLLFVYFQIQIILTLAFQQKKELFIIGLIIKFLAVLIIIIIIILVLLFHLTFHSYCNVSPNHLCSKFSTKTIILEFCNKWCNIILPYIVFMAKNAENQSYFQKISIAYTVTALIINLLKLYHQILYFTYLSEISTKIYQYCLTLQFSIITITFLCLSTQEILVIQNSMFVIFSLWIFLYYTIYFYKTSYSDSYQLMEQQQISSARQAEMYIWQLNKIYNKIGENQSLILTNIKKNHEQNCDDPGCICWFQKQTSNKLNQKESSNNLQKNDEMQKSKHHININTNKNINNEFSDRQKNQRNKKKQISKNDVQQLRERYERMLVIRIMDKICDKYKDNAQIIFLVAYAKLRVFSIFGDTLERMTKINNNSFNFSLQNMSIKEICFKSFVQKFILNLKSFIQTKNNEKDIAETQKCIQLDNLVQQMINKIQTMIELKVEFWSCFSKGAVLYKYFSKKINEQIFLMKQFYQFNNYVLKNFKNNHLIISMLLGYQRFILFKDKISKEVAQSVKMLRIFNYKNHIFKVQKNQRDSIQKWIHSQTCCAFETLVNAQQMGTVVSASKNVESVFGYKSQLLQGLNINKLMPTSMQDQHDYLLNNWVKSCSWTNVGKIRNIFCVSRSNISFSCGIYLKLIQRLESIHILGCIFKQNQEDYMIVDHNGIIVGAGSKFFSLLGNVLVGLPIKFICAQHKHIQKWAKQSLRTRHRTVFYSTKRHTQILHKYLEQRFSIQKNQELIQELKQIFNRSPQVQGHVIQVEVHPYNIGRIMFSVIKIETTVSQFQALKNASSSFNNSFNYDEKSCKQNKQQGRTNSIQPLADEQNFLACNSSVGSSTEIGKLSIQNNIDNIQEMFYKQNKINDKRIHRIIFAIALLCLAGICISSSKIYINYQGFQQMQQLFFADGACSDNLQLSMFIYNKALTVNLKLRKYQQTLNNQQKESFYRQIADQKFQQNYLHSLVIAEIMNMNKYLTSLSKLSMFGYENRPVVWTKPDGQVIQILTTNFMINYIYLAKKIAQQSVQVSKQLEKKQNNWNKLEQLRKNNERNLHSMQQNFDTLFFINGDNLEYFHRLFMSTKRQIAIIGYMKIVSTLIILIILLLIMYLHDGYRQRQSDQIYAEYKMITVDIVINIVKYFSDFKFIIKMNCHRRIGNTSSNLNEYSRQNANTSVFNSEPTSCHSITIENSKQNNAIKQKENCKVDFKLDDNKKQNNEGQRSLNNPKYKQQISNKGPTNHYNIEAKLLQVGTIYDSCVLEQSNKASHHKILLNLHEKYFSFKKVIYLSIFILVATINVSMITTQKSILDTSQTMITNINNLMQSQNDLMSAYFKIKSQPNSTIPQILSLLQRVKNTQVVFNKVAVSSLTLFVNYDPTYITKMIDILTSNICEIVATKLPSDYYRSCVEDSRANMLKFGVINSMSFFYRRVQEILHLLLDLGEDRGEKYLQQLTVLDDVDMSLIYMLKIYQQTQSQITQSLIIAINNQNMQYLLQISIQYLVFLGLIIFLFAFYKIQYRNSVHRIGKILILPIKMLKSNRKIIKNLENIIDYHNIK